MHLAHPLRVTLGQIVVDRHHMHALSLQRVQISGQQKGLGLSFAGLHLGDTPLMHDDAADQLHSVMLCLQYPSCRLPHQSVGLRQNIVQCLPLFQATLELLRSGLHLLVRQLHHPGTKSLNGIHKGHYTPEFPLAVRPEYLFRQFHLYLIPAYRRQIRDTHYIPIIIPEQNYCSRFIPGIQPR